MVLMVINWVKNDDDPYNLVVVPAHKVRNINWSVATQKWGYDRTGVFRNMTWDIV